MVTESLVWIAGQLIMLFVPEILLWIFVEKSRNRFKFRFSSVRGYPGLKPFANTWAVGISALLIYLFSPHIFEFILGVAINSWLISLSLLKISLLVVSLSAFNLIFVVNYILERKPNITTAKVGAIAIISFIAFLFV